MENWDKEKFQQSLSSHEIYFSDDALKGESHSIEDLECVVVFIMCGSIK